MSEGYGQQLKLLTVNNHKFHPISGLISIPSHIHIFFVRNMSMSWVWTAIKITEIQRSLYPQASTKLFSFFLVTFSNPFNYLKVTVKKT